LNCWRIQYPVSLHAQCWSSYSVLWQKMNVCPYTQH
jgi:hypothetical protein